MSRTATAPPDSVSCTPSRAARELDLKRAEFELAVHLGRIRTVPDEAGGTRKVPRAEIDRLRAQPGFPDSLRASVKTVGTAEGATLLDVPPTRFTRLARLGLVVPVRFYLNRYRAVVWLYLAEELSHFAADRTNAFLLTGRTPEVLRSQLAAGVDLRARNWRGRHLGFLLRQAEGPWQHAGVLAGFLDPLQVAEIVKDPYERSHLNRFRPGSPAHCAPGTPAAHLVEKIITAADPDEIDWLRSDLQRTMDEARADQPAPRPAPKRAPTRPSEHSGTHGKSEPGRPAHGKSDPDRPPGKPGPDRPAHGKPDVDRPARGLLKRLRRRSA
ncbi:DUF6397 family protein [Streptomyces scabiei]|uniref:DUF6397 family protein n=1 Tax=Streptomyces scabiei TaxID=1930 RepID=UPI0029A5124A|nr:DUF6397 family protein [Streptomyces scabiei]MDX3112199.1 DUF6397 family protein [Streptomyces scabiei]